MSDYKKYFYKAIQKNFPNTFEEIKADVEANYQDISIDTAFAATSKNPIDKRLDFCAYFLALIKTLDKKGESFDHIRIICLDIVTEYVKPKNKWQAFLKRLPPKLINAWFAPFLLKKFNKRVSQNAHSQGFIARIITDKKETFGFGYGVDILECGICKLFKKHHFEKYAPILCEVDEVTSSLAGLELIRTGTIANGAKKCDFRFKKVEE